MSQYANEEQEMEAEALAAIFDTHFTAVSPHHWTLALFPAMGGAAEDDSDPANCHVACQLQVTLPPDYPDTSLPDIKVAVVKGLSEEHAVLLTDLAVTEAEANQGAPSIFAIAERLKEWLLENNVKGLDDLSMHAQMMRKITQSEQATQRSAAAQFEAQTQSEQLSAAELEELTVRKRREEGTPCTLANFLAWKARFDQEMASNKENNNNNILDGDDKAKKKEKKVGDDKVGRITGFEFFSSKAGNLEAFEKLEAAAENAERDEDEEDFDENLFQDDVDLDDLDFDDDDDDDDSVDI